MCIVVEGLSGSEVRHFSILKQKKRSVQDELSKPEKDYPCDGQGQLPQRNLGATAEDQKAFAGQVITKRSFAVVRFGVEYDHMKAVQLKRESGELPAQNAGLKWGEWEMFPYFIRHNGSMYLRCNPSHNNPVTTEYYLNGVKVDKAQIENMCLASEFRKTEALDTFTVNVENVIAVR